LSCHVYAHLCATGIVLDARPCGCRRSHWLCASARWDHIRQDGVVIHPCVPAYATVSWQDDQHNFQLLTNIGQWARAASAVTVIIECKAHSSKTVLRPPSSLRALPVDASATHSSSGPRGRLPTPPAAQRLAITHVQFDQQLLLDTCTLACLEVMDMRCSTVTCAADGERHLGAVLAPGWEVEPGARRHAAHNRLLLRRHRNGGVIRHCCRRSIAFNPPDPSIPETEMP
jgi:hypothetical protein